MELIEKYLQLWKEDQNGNPIPVKSNDLSNSIKSINTKDNNVLIKKQLRDEDYIETNLLGEYQLTKKGVLEWKNLIHTKIKPFTQNTTGKEWDKFRNLLSYYVECAKLSETPTHVFYGDKENVDFFIPKSMPIDWLKDLTLVTEGSELNITYSKDNEYIINQFKTNFNEDDAIYIGYPTIAYKSRNGNLIYYPVGVIPVTVKLKSSSLEVNPLTTLTLIPDFFQAKINTKILNLYVPENKVKSFLRNISNTHHDDEFMGLFDLYRSTNAIEKMFSKNYRDEKLKPVMPSQFLPKDLIKGERILCNSVVIYEERDFKYSKVMIKELQYIKNNISDADLDKTSLAYIYRNPILEQTQRGNKVGISFIESNYEQLECLENAINTPCSKITGPPGTGKSQVATNIIANSIFYNESVLFTSKNQKAVAAIRTRTESLLKDINSNLYLTEFCYDESKTMNNPWYRKDVTTSIPNGITYPIDTNDSALLDRNIELLNYQKDIIANKNLLISKYYNAVEEYSNSKNTFLKSILSESDEVKLSISEVNHLKESIKCLKDKNSSLLGNIIWKKFYKVPDEKALDNIQKLLPNAYHLKLSKLTKKEIKKEVETIIKNYEQYLDNDKTYQQLLHLIEQSNNDKSIESKIKKYYKVFDECKFNGFCHKQNIRLQQYEDNTNLINLVDSLEGKYRNKDATAILKRNIESETINDCIFFSHFLKFHPSWAVTLLSLKYASPCLPGIFDRVIIDEAAQCDCVSIIPALFRAKNVVVMGDKQQLPPILEISSHRDEYFWNKFKLTGMEKYNFLQTTAYSVVPSTETMLKEHFRCDPEIAEIFSSHFYNGELRTRTDKSKLNFPKNCGYKSAVEWIDIKDSFMNEIEATITHVTTLLSNNYTGTIGIISPLKIVVNTIQERLDALNVDPEKVISKTIASFQGSECDVIIFVVAYNEEIFKSKGKHWYLTDKSNSYIYNVAISRAKALLLFVGDREACRNSKVPILEKMANSPKPIKPINKSDEPIFESPWEKNLYYALENANIKTQTQVPLVGRRLDLAYISDDVKIDIEVDGVAFHTNKSGNVKMDDIFRDMQVEAAGWFVIRFWVYELQKDMDGCIEKIKQIITLKGYPTLDNVDNSKT